MLSGNLMQQMVQMLFGSLSNCDTQSGLTPVSLPTIHDDHILEAYCFTLHIIVGFKCIRWYLHVHFTRPSRDYSLCGILWFIHSGFPHHDGILYYFRKRKKSHNFMHMSVKNCRKTTKTLSRKKLCFKYLLNLSCAVYVQNLENTIKQRFVIYNFVNFIFFFRIRWLILIMYNIRGCYLIWYNCREITFNTKSLILLFSSPSKYYFLSFQVRTCLL